jgi:biotin carboxyl carrier protein
MNRQPQPTEFDRAAGHTEAARNSEQTVAQRLAYLRKHFEAEEVLKRADDTVERKRRWYDVSARRLLKTAIAVAVAAFIVWLPAQRLLQTTSVEAVVNAQLVTLRSPIDGVVSSELRNLALGADIEQGIQMLRITNTRADRGRMDDLRRLVERSEAEEAVLIKRIENVGQMQAEFIGQTHLFQKGRIRQLVARIEESRSTLGAATQRQQETSAVLERARSLDTKGFQPKALLDKAQRDNEIAVQDARSIEHRIQGIEVELEAARDGTFLGDSYNDRPRSAQRADEMKQLVFDLTAQLAERQSGLPQLRNDLIVEQTRQDVNAGAIVTAPAGGKIWELLTAGGEQVQRGQELVRVLDCKAAVVTAVVSEAVYNRLQVGTVANFRFRDSEQAMAGRIVNLTGVASAPANFAIAPSSLNRESYRVVVSVPDLVKSGQSCSLGRTGQVVFEDRVAASPATN